MQSSRANQVFIVGSVYTDGDVGIAGVHMNEDDAENQYIRMEDRHFAGDGIKYNFRTHAPLYVRNDNS